MSKRNDYGAPMKRLRWGGAELPWCPGRLAYLEPRLRVGLRNFSAYAHFPTKGSGGLGVDEKKKVDCDPELRDDLAALVEPLTRGDPESPLRWVSKSTRKLAAMLNRQGHMVSRRIVNQLLHDEDYSLQSNRKRDEGAKEHPDRDAQFQYIARKTAQFQANHQPVVSVDAKKKENVGNYQNAGRTYRKAGHPAEVKAYDFTGPLGKVVPYGIYDVTYNKGWVSVGVSHNTAEFAVKSIRTWWQQMGRYGYPDAREILLTADCGGSNGYRVRLWKWELQQWATVVRLHVHVSHYPPGTSKWNKIEHRMFNAITANWRGEPLVDYETVLAFIRHAGTEEGLEIQAALDTAIYPVGRKISDEAMNTLNIQHDTFHGEWNYTISPQE